MSVDRFFRDFIRSGATLGDEGLSGYTTHPEERYILSLLAQEFHSKKELIRKEIDLDTYYRTMRFPGVVRHRYLHHVDPTVTDNPFVSYVGPVQGPRNLDIRPPHLIQKAVAPVATRTAEEDPEAVGTWRVRPKEGSTTPVEVILYSAPDYVAKASDEMHFRSHQAIYPTMSKSLY